MAGNWAQTLDPLVKYLLQGPENARNLRQGFVTAFEKNDKKQMIALLQQLEETISAWSISHPALSPIYELRKAYKSPTVDPDLLTALPIIAGRIKIAYVLEEFNAVEFPDCIIKPKVTNIVDDLNLSELKTQFEDLKQLLAIRTEQIQIITEFQSKFPNTYCEQALANLNQQFTAFASLTVSDLSALNNELLTCIQANNFDPKNIKTFEELAAKNATETEQSALRMFLASKHFQQQDYAKVHNILVKRSRIIETDAHDRAFYVNNLPDCEAIALDGHLNSENLDIIETKLDAIIAQQKIRKKIIIIDKLSAITPKNDYLKLNAILTANFELACSILETEAVCKAPAEIQYFVAACELIRLGKLITITIPDKKWDKNLSPAQQQAYKDNIHNPFLLLNELSPNNHWLLPLMHAFKLAIIHTPEHTDACIYAAAAVLKKELSITLAPNQAWFTKALRNQITALKQTMQNLNMYYVDIFVHKTYAEDLNCPTFKTAIFEHELKTSQILFRGIALSCAAHAVTANNSFNFDQIFNMSLTNMLDAIDKLEILSQQESYFFKLQLVEVIDTRLNMKRKQTPETYIKQQFISPKFAQIFTPKLYQDSTKLLATGLSNYTTFSLHNPKSYYSKPLTLVKLGALTSVSSAAFILGISALVASSKGLLIAAALGALFTGPIGWAVLIGVTALAVGLCYAYGRAKQAEDRRNAAQLELDISRGLEDISVKQPKLVAPVASNSAVIRPVVTSPILHSSVVNNKAVTPFAVTTPFTITKQITQPEPLREPTPRQLQAKAYLENYREGAGATFNEAEILDAYCAWTETPCPEQPKDRRTLLEKVDTLLGFDTDPNLKNPKPKLNLDSLRPKAQTLSKLGAFRF